MTSHRMKPRQRSVPLGTTVREMLSHRPAPQRSGPQRNLGEGPFPSLRFLSLSREVLLTFAPLSCFPSSYHSFQKSQPFFGFFDTLFAKKQGRPFAVPAFCFQPAGYWAPSLSQERMMPFSNSKVVVLTMWGLPTRTSWVPNSLVRLSFTVASMVKTRS